MPDSPAAVTTGRNNYGGVMANDEPLDAPVILTRRVDIDPGRYYLTNTLAIIQEEHGEWSCPAPLFVEVQVTDHPKANDGSLTSMATAIYLKAVNRLKGWLAAYHVDLWHTGTGSSIGVNVEAKRSNPAGVVIGYNAQCDVDSAPHRSDYAYYSNGPWKKRFHSTAAGSLLSCGEVDVITVRDDGATIWGSHKDPTTKELIGSFATDSAGNLYAGRVISPGVRALMVLDGVVWINGRKM